MAEKACIFGCPNLADGGTVTMTGAVTNLPASNLLTVQPRQVARSTTLTSCDIDVDLGAVYDVDSIALVNHNLGASGTWRIYADDNSSSFASPTYDPGASNIHETTIAAALLAKIQPTAVRILSSSVSARYVRIRLTDAANPASFLQAGRVVIGLSWRVWLRKPWQIGVKDLSVVEETAGGGAARWDQPRQTTMKVSLDEENDSAFGNLLSDIMLMKGIGGDLIVVPKPDVLSKYHLQAKYFRIAGWDPLAGAGYLRYTGGLELVEWR